MELPLVFAAYFVTGLGAVAIFAALPKEGRLPRRAQVIPLLGFALGAVLLFLGQLLPDAASNRVYVCLFSAIAIGGAVRVITHPRPVYAALFFILVVLSAAAMMFLAGAEFVGVALVMVYAGAILVTYVFVIMLAQQSAPSTGGMFAEALDYDRSAREPIAAILAGFVLVGAIGGVIAHHSWEPLDALRSAAPDESNTLALGRVLLTDFAISVELAGVLLTVAMVGAMAIARKNLPADDDGADAPAPGEIGKRVSPF